MPTGACSAEWQGSHCPQHSYQQPPSDSSVPKPSVEAQRMQQLFYPPVSPSAGEHSRAAQQSVPRSRLKICSQCVCGTGAGPCRATQHMQLGCLAIWDDTRSPCNAPQRPFPGWRKDIPRRREWCGHTPLGQPSYLKTARPASLGGSGRGTPRLGCTSSNAGSSRP